MQRQPKMVLLCMSATCTPTQWRHGSGTTEYDRERGTSTAFGTLPKTHPLNGLGLENEFANNLAFWLISDVRGRSTHVANCFCWEYSNSIKCSPYTRTYVKIFTFQIIIRIRIASWHDHLRASWRTLIINCMHFLFIFS
jgi:hypothetical protein